MNEAVNYIRHLQTRIRVLGRRRDELKIGTSSLPSLSASSSTSSTSPRVAVHPCFGGVEIVIRRVGYVEQGLVPIKTAKNTAWTRAYCNQLCYRPS